ncbi:MAG: hypothetical protein SGJ04_05440 [Bacteroidota bacterium]|nr:hypothetical protein [Bacteroidota bacterium]
MKNSNPEQLNLQNIVSRWQSPTPAFFKHLAELCILIALTGLSLMAGIPDCPQWLSSSLIAIGTVGKIISQLTTDNPNQPQTNEFNRKNPTARFRGTSKSIISR